MYFLSQCIQYKHFSKLFRIHVSCYFPNFCNFCSHFSNHFSNINATKPSTKRNQQVETYDKILNVDRYHLRSNINLICLLQFVDSIIFGVIVSILLLQVQYVMHIYDQNFISIEINQWIQNDDIILEIIFILFVHIHDVHKYLSLLAVVIHIVFNA